MLFVQELLKSMEPHILAYTESFRLLIPSASFNTAKSSFINILYLTL